MAEAVAAAGAAPREESGKPLSLYRLASYAAPSTPLALAGLPMAVYLPPLYADSDGFGLELALVGTIIMLSRLTDVVTDPVIGYLSDRLRTRWGRRKPWVLAGSPIYIFGIFMLFVPPWEFSEVTLLGFTFNWGYPYLLVMVAVVYLGSTIKDLPYYAWGAELGRTYNERTLIFSWREGFGVGGSLISAFTPAIILFFGYTKPSDAVYFLSWGMAAMMFVFVTNAMIAVPEYPVQETAKRRASIREGLRYVRGNKPYMMLVIVFLFSTLGAAMTNSLSFYFVKHVLLAGELYGLYLAPYFISQIAAVPFWFWLSRKVGKHRATMAAIFWYSLWSCFIPLIAIAPDDWFNAFEIPVLLAFLPVGMHEGIVGYFHGIDTGKFFFFILVMCLKGSSIGALAALPNAMAADVVDVDTARTGEQRAGAYFAIWSMVKKAAYAVGIFIGTASVVWFGFDANADPMNTTNTWTALIWLACFYSVIPAIFKFVGMPFLWRYPLTEERVLEVQQDIERQRAAAKAEEAAVR